jgi:hypothetical protein
MKKKRGENLGNEGRKRNNQESFRREENRRRKG